MPVRALKPRPLRRISSTTTSPSLPALKAICFIGASRARLTILMPVRSSPLLAAIRPSRPSANCSRVLPPPAMMPSSTAARVALRASSMRSLRLRSSVSVGAPTLITATPPASLAIRSESFSRS